MGSKVDAQRTSPGTHETHCLPVGGFESEMDKLFHLLRFHANRGAAIAAATQAVQDSLAHWQDSVDAAPAQKRQSSINPATESVADKTDLPAAAEHRVNNQTAGDTAPGHPSHSTLMPQAQPGCGRQQIRLPHVDLSQTLLEILSAHGGP